MSKQLVHVVTRRYIVLFTRPPTPLAPFLIQMNHARTVIPKFFKMHFNILPSTWRSFRGAFCGVSFGGCIKIRAVCLRCCESREAESRYVPR